VTVAGAVAGARAVTHYRCNMSPGFFLFLLLLSLHFEGVFDPVEHREIESETGYGKCSWRCPDFSHMVRGRVLRKGKLMGLRHNHSQGTPDTQDEKRPQILFYL
jgi:hypothetical protein